LLWKGGPTHWPKSASNTPGHDGNIMMFVFHSYLNYFISVKLNTLNG